jgi:hypothetical protein
LDESELAALEQFFLNEGGRTGIFSFTDPFDGSVSANCSFDTDTGLFAYADVGRGAAVVAIRENRS